MTMKYKSTHVFDIFICPYIRWKIGTLHNCKCGLNETLLKKSHHMSWISLQKKYLINENQETRLVTAQDLNQLRVLRRAQKSQTFFWMPTSVVKSSSFHIVKIASSFHSLHYSQPYDLKASFRCQHTPKNFPDGSHEIYQTVLKQEINKKNPHPASSRGFSKLYADVNRCHIFVWDMGRLSCEPRGIPQKGFREITSIT